LLNCELKLCFQFVKRLSSFKAVYRLANPHRPKLPFFWDTALTAAHLASP
jgi:hypothetical protein